MSKSKKTNILCVLSVAIWVIVAFGAVFDIVLFVKYVDKKTSVVEPITELSVDADLLTTSVFENDRNFELSTEPKSISFNKLTPGDVVITDKFSGVYVLEVEQNGKTEYEIDVYEAYVREMYTAFDYEHPEVFWLDNSTKVKRITADHVTYFFFVLADADGFNKKAPAWRENGSVQKGIERREKAVADIISQVPDNDPYLQIEAVNNILIKQNQYNSSKEPQNLGNEPRECLSALEGNVGADGPICTGYSKAFKVLCDRLYIPCRLVSGNSKSAFSSKYGRHMWNAVKIGDPWYSVDVTWNDPSVTGIEGSVSGAEREDYLLVGSDTEIDGQPFCKSHIADSPYGRIYEDEMSKCAFTPAN